MDDKYKSYDPKQYKQSSIDFTLTVLNKELEKLKYTRNLLVEHNTKGLNDEGIKQTEKKIIELKNNMAFLKEYR